MQLLSIEIRNNTEFRRTVLVITPCSAPALASYSESNLLPMGTAGVHNVSSSFMYCFMEMEAKKDSNSVASFLNHALKKKLIEFSNVKKMILLSDACGGQNKNSVMTSFCSWLARVYEVEVTHLFPVRGHSFGQCDRNFRLIKSKLKKVETISTALPYLSAMVQCRTYPLLFEVCMDRTLIKDWKSGLKEYCLPKPIAKGVHSRYTQLKYRAYN